MPASLIPALDPAPIPGPPWLFHALWIVTFLIHVVFLNLALGGSLLAALIGDRRPGGRETRTLLVGVNAWTISFAITFGIAPLLFIQVLLGRFFYTATILVGQAWFGLLIVLLVGYYLNYVAKYRLRDGKPVGAVLWLEALCFLAIAVVQVTVNLLHMQPDRWPQVAGNAWVALADPAFLPRLLHFVLAAASMSGALVAWVAVRRSQKGGDAKILDAMARFGIRAALTATVLQLIDGFWLLMALPEPVLRSFMGGGPLALLPLTLGIVAAVLLLLVIAQISQPLQQATKVRRLAELIIGAMLFMIITRHQLRAIYLAPARASEQLNVQPQWGVFALFLVVFLMGVGLTVYGMVRAARDRAGEGEPAA